MLVSIESAREAGGGVVAISKIVDPKKGTLPCSNFRRWLWIGLACMGSNRSMNIFFRRMRLTWTGCERRL